MIPTTVRQMTISSRPSSASRRCSGVVSGGDRSSRVAIRPSWVFMPVAMTTAAARPPATTVPACTIDRRSPSGVAAGSRSTGPFSTGRLSPVSDDSCTRRP